MICSTICAIKVLISLQIELLWRYSQYLYVDIDSQLILTYMVCSTICANKVLFSLQIELLWPYSQYRYVDTYAFICRLTSGAIL